jgi:hypothetical protein
MIVNAVVTVVRRNIWPVLIGLVASSLLVGLYAAPFLFADGQCSSPDTAVSPTDCQSYPPASSRSCAVHP